ncbi:MAG: DUF1963 domain-containing protein [Bacilli bacterium]|nr:DUF1963 domain-containing protein [Bacilli bacterium]
MEMIRFRLKRVEKEENKDLDASKLLGSPVFPKNFLKRNRIGSNYYFLAQINCAELPSISPFPSKGYLYFFVDINEFKAKVVFTEEELEELIEDINDNFDREICGDPTCLRMEFEDGGEGESGVFGDIDPNIGLEGETEVEGKVVLLQLDAYSLPEDPRPLTFSDFGLRDGYWVFLIEKDDLEKGDYRRVELIEVGY